MVDQTVCSPLYACYRTFVKRNVLFGAETYFSFTSAFECVEQLHFLKALTNLNRNVPLLLDKIDD